METTASMSDFMPAPTPYNLMVAITDKHLSLDSLRSLSTFLMHVCYAHPLTPAHVNFDQWMDQEQGFHQCCALRMSGLPVGVRHLERLMNQLTLSELHSLNNDLDRGLARAIDNEEQELLAHMKVAELTCRDIRDAWMRGFVYTGAFTFGRETVRMLAERNLCICKNCW